MHNHDNDLIATLAEGVLAEELAAAAEAEIEACPECAPELAAQRTARAALGTIPPAGLTLSEAARLRDAIAGSLGLADSPAQRTVQRARRSPWRAIAVASGLAGIIMIIPAMGLLTGSDDAGTTDTIAAALEIRDDSVTSLRDPAGEAPPEGAEMAAAGASDLQEGGETPPPTAEAATTTIAATLGAGPANVELSADGQAAIREMYEAGPTEDLGTTTERTGLDCSAEAEQTFGDSYLYVPLAATLDDGRPVVLYAAADWSALVAFDLADCSAVLELP